MDIWEFISHLGLRIILGRFYVEYSALMTSDETKCKRNFACIAEFWELLFDFVFH
jgi:hypothetical protein